MKKQIRFTLLFALTLALLLGIIAVAPFATSADDQFTLTVKVVDRSGETIENYGYVSNDTGGGFSNESVILYKASIGTKITLSVHGNGGYTFVGWKDDPASKFNLGSGTNGETFSYTIGSEDATRYVVFEPTEYNVYFVGAKSGQNEIPDAVKSKYGTDEEFHPSYPTPDRIKHTYGTSTTLDEVIAITESGEQTHQFAGWKAYDLSGIEIELEENTIGANVSCDVYLVPQWEPLQFTVTRIDRIGTPENYEETELGRYEELVNYGAPINGKDFGDTPDYVGYRFNDSDATLYTEAVVTTEGAVVYRYYTPCEYLVTFDVNAPDADSVTDRGIREISVTYKKAFLQIISVPKCTGYQFMGYYYVTEEGEEILYYDRLGRLGENKTWEIPQDVTLKAKWELQKHSVIVRVVDGNQQDCSSSVEILINDNPNPGAMDYGTRGEVKVTVLSGKDKKLTKWNGETIPHTLSVTGEFEIGEADVVFIVQVLSTEATPSLSVNYAKEVLEGFKPGVYRITADDVSRTVTVAADGSVDSTDAISLSNLFGKTLLVIRPGVENQTADGEVQELVLNARPAAVTKDAYTQTVVETKQTRELIFAIANGSEIEYEIAVTNSSKEEPQNWTTDLHLTGLEAGKSYTVWMRVRATETAPHGEEVKVLKNFEFSYLVDLKPLFIILVCMFALQLLALVFLLISRHRARMNAIAAPLLALLAVKAIPAGFFPWVIVLTIAVIGLQVVLVCLALQTSVIWQKRTDNKKEKKKKQSGNETTEFSLFGEETKPAGGDPSNKDENQ